jgi:hypothetical protein
MEQPASEIFAGDGPAENPIGKLKAMTLPGDGPNEVYRVSSRDVEALKKRQNVVILKKWE